MKLIFTLPFGMCLVFNTKVNDKNVIELSQIYHYKTAIPTKLAFRSFIQSCRSSSDIKGIFHDFHEKKVGLQMNKKITTLQRHCNSCYDFQSKITPLRRGKRKKCNPLRIHEIADSTLDQHWGRRRRIRSRRT